MFSFPDCQIKVKMYFTPLRLPVSLHNQVPLGTGVVAFTVGEGHEFIQHRP